jgi:hypothetical protein
VCEEDEGLGVRMMNDTQWTFDVIVPRVVTVGRLAPSTRIGSKKSTKHARSDTSIWTPQLKHLEA